VWKSRDEGNARRVHNLSHVAVWCSVLQCVAECVAVCFSILQCGNLTTRALPEEGMI